VHEDCLFYHNCVSKRMHLDSSCDIKVSPPPAFSMLACFLLAFVCARCRNCNIKVYPPLSSGIWRTLWF
jgi:hypothetical protein